MGHSHGASEAWLPYQDARRVLTWGLVCLCAWASVSRAQEPRLLEPLPPVTDQAARAVQPVATGASPPASRVPSTIAPESGPTFLDGFQAVDPNSPYLIRRAGYASEYPDARRGVPSVAMRNNKSILNFNGMQDPNASPDVVEGLPEEGSGADEGEGGEEGAEGEEDEQTYGQAPTNNSLQFLRQVDVLLKPGAWQFDTGFVYTLFTNDFPVPIFDGGGVIENVVEGEVRRRLLWTPLAVRYGFRKNIQLFANLPVGFSNTQLSTIGVSQSRNVSGLGDLTAGATTHLIRGEDHMPDLIGTFGFTAPTGKFDVPIFGLVPGSNLGQGFWALAGQGLFIHRYDPVIVFYGGGYRYLFERPFNGVLFAPGQQVNYMFGAGFSVNDRVTLSSTFQGFYITNTAIDGEDLRGSNLEPLSLRFSLTTVLDCRIIEPFVQIGLTDAAPRADVGVVVTFY